MRRILLIGAGRSSSSLINYFLENAKTENWTLTVGDVSVESARQKTNDHPAATAIQFDINSQTDREKHIREADIVISLLPAHMHLPVAIECVKQRKDLVTASYVSPEMQELDAGAKVAGVILLNECGLDPGIDHMSAMQIIDEIKSKGAELTSFKSYTGGLVAPESNDNPWGYKFSWNPRNVILAGQGTARFIENGKYKYIPYNRLFTEIETINVAENTSYDGYANRDSLAYRHLYGLESIPTMLRGTLRQKGYCKAWNVFVKLGLTDDSFIVEGSSKMTYAQVVEAFIPNSVKGISLMDRLATFMNCQVNDDSLKLVEWTGILTDEAITIPDSTPAQILQSLLERKWLLRPEDKDMIVMQHIFEYNLAGKNVHHTSSLVVKGDNSVYTAMAKTVGLPVAIAAKNILNKKILLKGVQIPVDKTIYEPVLQELGKYGIRFEEKIS
ncbi:MAG: saccharopine dehydrogenase C-terminal domain-containing protein [Bacteroidota bacterium]